MAAVDQAARDAIRQRLDETMFVEAGAGSGKTKSLVDRFVALVEDGVEADRIAAITFTEKAAGELADRIRVELQKGSATSQHCRDALAALDRSAICTLHAFAQRLLTSHPIEAGLPPRLTVLDEIASQIAFEARWEAFLDRIIDDDDLERPLRLLLAAGARMDHLHEVAVKFGQNWDLVAERLDGRAVGDVPPVDVAPLADAVDALSARRGECSQDADKLVRRLDELAVWAESLRTAADEDARLEVLLSAPSFAAGVGRKPAWDDIESVRDQVRALEEMRDRLRDCVQHACLERLAQELARFTVAAAAERRAAGELEFHDLLVLGRAVLRDRGQGVAVRAALHRRYRHLLLDEFQDTDPIQIELAVLIASTDPDAAFKEWSEVEVEPGALFFVGDPKQSIYRFRRADIAVFLRARHALGGDRQELTTNFRTVPRILAWVNHTFGQLIEAEGESQPEYIALQPARSASPSGPAVAFIGMGEHPRTWRAGELRRAEAADVAAVIREAIGERWSVFDEETRCWRDPRWSDVAILLPARTSLRQLERALDDAAVPYRAETSSLVYGTGEVRDLLTVAHAVEDPTDSLAVVAGLRTPAFGCGDDDLYVWKTAHRGRWDHQAPIPEGAADHVVARGLAWLNGLHRERTWLSPSQVLERIVRERRLMEVAFVHPRPRDLWRRLRFVVDQCRAWEEAGGGTLRDYLRWVKLQSAEGSRVIETVLPETDDDAVRILTVHGAKGLEFPITVLSGMTTQLRGRQSGVQVLFPPTDGWALRLKKDLETDEFRDFQPIDEQMDAHERLRLLYVAATRARDHLVVSVHRKEAGNRAPSAAELFYEKGWEPSLVEPLAFVGELQDSPTTTAFHIGGVAPPPLDEWERERAAAFTTGTRPVAVSATRLAEEASRAAELERLAGLEKDAADVDLPPWQKGRYGSAVGRAVHAALQTVDLVTGEGLEDAAAAQAAAEGVLGKEGVVVALCQSALASEVVQRAAQRPHWREVYVGAPHEVYGVLEGYVDLLYRDDDGLVVVDYKTDAWRADAELDSKVDRYRPQLQAYVEALRVAVGPVVGATLLFLSTNGSFARQVPV